MCVYGGGVVPQGGVGDRHLVTIPQGVVGDRLPWGGERHGGGEGTKTGTVRTVCPGACCTVVTKAVGIVMVLGVGPEGMAFAEPTAPTASWDLELGPPGMSLRAAYPEYLSGIFTGVLKNMLPRAKSWCSQKLSACAWLQVELLSGFSRSVVMRAMHKAVSFCVG